MSPDPLANSSFFSLAIPGCFRAVDTGVNPLSLCLSHDSHLKSGVLVATL